MSATKDTVRKIIRNNRPEFATHQLFIIIERLEKALETTHQELRESNDRCTDLEVTRNEHNALLARVESAERERDELRKALEEVREATVCLELHADNEVVAEELSGNQAKLHAARIHSAACLGIGLEVRTIIDAALARTAPAQQAKPRTCGECAFFNVHSGACPFTASGLLTSSSACDEFEPRADAQEVKP